MNTPICANCIFYRKSPYINANSSDDKCIYYVISVDMVRGTKHYNTCVDMRTDEKLCGKNGNLYQTV